ncbi:MAG: class I SAM-dependent methyltransferase [Acidobacteriota bacterium]
MDRPDIDALVDFESYSRKAVHFFSLHVPPLLASAVKAQADGFTILDLGCGDGNIIYALKHSGLLDRAGKVIGVDLSPQRIERFTANAGYDGIISGAERVEQIGDGKVDLLLNTMVIEHVPDDAGLLLEVKRMLKAGGLVYVTTVLKLQGAWYFRRTPDGRRALDPTHMREYASREAFEQLIREAGLGIVEVDVSPLSFSVIHPILRIVNSIVGLRGINKIFLRKGLLSWIEKIALPIPRYRVIEVLARKKN